LAEGASFSWGAFDGITAGIARAKAARDKGARRGLLLGARVVLNASNRQVPHEEGDLERDGGVSVDDSKLVAAVAYGRSAQTKAYAEVQHERMDYHHDAGRNAKYLENALNSTHDQVAAVIAQAIQGEMG
jgi:hypothetical protein